MDFCGGERVKVRHRTAAFVVIVIAVAVTLTVTLRLTFLGPASPEATMWQIASQLHAPGDTTTETAAASPVPAAWQIRQQILSLLQKGETQQQILSQLQDEYGPTILANPSLAGFGAWVWILPPVAVMLLFVIIAGILISRLKRDGRPMRAIQTFHQDDPIVQEIDEDELSTFRTYL